MKVACIYLCNYKDKNDYYISLMPSGIISIASYLESKGFDVVLANLSTYGAKKGVDIILKEDPDAIAISIFSYNREESFKFIKEIKKHNADIKIIAGGQHPTFLSEELLKEYPEIDYVVKGEGEIAVEEILQQHKKITAKIISRERIAKLDELPFVSAFSGRMIGVNPNEQFQFIITSRGCPSHCTYCSSPNFWKQKVTFRSAKSIIDELMLLRDKYGVIYFSIRDDNFTLNKKRVIEFTDLLRKSELNMMWDCQARVDTIDYEMLMAMKSCGLEHIQFGVESGSEKILRLYDKSITADMIKKAAEATRRAGIYLSFYLMVGMDEESEDDIDLTIKLLHEALPHDAVISPVAFYPGTELYNISRKKGKVSDEIWLKAKPEAVYLKDQKITLPQINKIMKELAVVSKRASYTLKDFKKMKEAENGGFWITHIMEGDYYVSRGHISEGQKAYKNLIKKYPQNIWGYLRLGDLLTNIYPLESIKYLHQATEIAPAYYWPWFLIATVQLNLKRYKDAYSSAQKALKLNPYDNDVLSLIKKLSKLK